jgi:hypothetical protein
LLDWYGALRESGGKAATNDENGISHLFAPA